MSRVAKKPINLPKGVEVKSDAAGISVKGPKGTLAIHHLPGASINIDNGVASIVLAEGADDKFGGTLRALLANMVKGVTDGWERKLEINGVGYRADVAGQKLNLALGFSHPVAFDLPKGIGAKVDKNIIVLSGIDKEILGETASKIRAIRPPEPYKGKGIKYVEEVIKRKVGKTGAA